MFKDTTAARFWARILPMSPMLRSKLPQLYSNSLSLPSENWTQLFSPVFLLAMETKIQPPLKTGLCTLSLCADVRPHPAACTVSGRLGLGYVGTTFSLWKISCGKWWPDLWTSDTSDDLAHATGSFIRVINQLIISASEGTGNYAVISCAINESDDQHTHIQMHEC